ncbi:MAG: transcription termination factor NusA [Thermodesulfovibrionales bacterium]|nr:transcription termination factor NusA [Thermodesulfovibrionales bacterium]
MSKELCNIINQISKEKGISQQSIIKLLESALITAAKKKFGGNPNILVRIDTKTCELQVLEKKKLVKNVTNKNNEVAFDEYKDLFPDKSIGDEIEVPISVQDFGRIAAQTAKQVLLQKVRELEKDLIYDEFKDKVGQIVTVTVNRKEKANYYVTLKNVEAILPQKETLANENLKRGDVVKAYLVDIKKTSKGPLIFLSRSCPEFVIELLKQEVPEINDNIVVIKGVAREPSERTKIAVTSNDPAIDPVGACVGMKGTRIQSIVREIKGERIDIIAWSNDPRVFIARALTPATVNMVGLNEEEKTAMVVANDEQLSLAIGKKGQNIKLATKLTGWEIEILSESEYSKIRTEELEKNFRGEK